MKNSWFSQRVAGLTLGALLLTCAGAFNTNAAATYGGSARALYVNVTGFSPVVVADTGGIPAEGGEVETSTLDVNQAGGKVKAQVCTSYAIGTAEAEYDVSYSETSVSKGVIIAGLNVITYDAISSWAMAVNCYPNIPKISGASQIVNLKVNGVAVDAKSGPNSTISIIGGKLVLNEQLTYLGEDDGAITVSALHVYVYGVADIVVASANATIVGNDVE